MLLPTIYPNRLIPETGLILTVDLPGERMRATIRAVHDDDHAVVQLIGVPMAKSHQFREGDSLLVTRKWGSFGEIWEAMDDRLLALQAMEEKQMAKVKKKKPKQKKRTPTPVVPAKKEKRSAVGRK